MAYKPCPSSPAPTAIIGHHSATAAGL